MHHLLQNKIINNSYNLSEWKAFAVNFFFITYLLFFYIYFFFFCFCRVLARQSHGHMAVNFFLLLIYYSFILFIFFLLVGKATDFTFRFWNAQLGPSIRRTRTSRNPVKRLDGIPVYPPVRIHHEIFEYKAMQCSHSY